MLKLLSASNSEDSDGISGSVEYELSSVGDLIGDNGDMLFTTGGGDTPGSGGSSVELSFIFLLECWTECGNGDDLRREVSALRLHLTDGELKTSGGPLNRNGERKECGCDGLFSGAGGIIGLLNAAAQASGLSADIRLSLWTASFTILLQSSHTNKGTTTKKRCMTF